MRKVLYILSNEPTGGVGTVVLNYQSHFSANLQIDYLIYTDERNTAFQNKIKAMNSKIHYMPEFKLKNLRKLFTNTNLFFKQYSKEYPVIHLHFAGIASFVFYFAKKYGIKNRIVHSHNTKLSDHFIKNVRNRIMCLGMKYYSTAFFACSKNAARYLYGKKFCNQHDIFIMNNAVDTELYSFKHQDREKIRNQYHITDEKVLVHVGRFELQKNHEFMIDLMECLSDKRIKLFFIGDGPLKSEIQKKVQDRKLTNSIIFTGVVQNVMEYLSAADIFVLPSLYEGLPLTAVEAQASGLFCLLSDTITSECSVGGHVEYLSIQSKERWINLINEYNEKRENGKLGLDYNIINKAQQVEKIYIELSDKTF